MLGDGHSVGKKLQHGILARAGGETETRIYKIQFLVVIKLFLWKKQRG